VSTHPNHAVHVPSAHLRHAVCVLWVCCAEVEQLLAGKPRFRKLEFSADMLSDPRDLTELRRRYPKVWARQAVGCGLRAGKARGGCV